MKVCLQQRPVDSASAAVPELGANLAATGLILRRIEAPYVAPIEPQVRPGPYQRGLDKVLSLRSRPRTSQAIMMRAAS